MKYRKRPVVIEAFRYDGDMVNRDGLHYVPDWAFLALNDETMYYAGQGELYIKTLEGDHHVSVGDYIIRGVAGELYPCKPDIFEQTYDPAESAHTVDAAPVVHGNPVCKNRPEHYYNYELMAQTEDGEPLYKRVHKISENNLVEYCPVCGKRLCSRFRSYCPSCGAKMDL